MSDAECRVLKFVRHIPEPYIPVRATPQSVGLGLKSAFRYVIPARGRVLIDTGLKIEVPKGCYGRIVPRSGLAINYGIDVGAGAVDPDYRGIIKVLLFNHSDSDFIVESAERIAQLICEKVMTPYHLQVFDFIETTEIGTMGFGLSGMQ
nr:unnamed protein product [Callosobruchus analis]